MKGGDCMKRKILLTATFLFVLMVVLPRLSFAFYLLDDKLRVKGSIYEFSIIGTNIDHKVKHYRDTNLGLMRTKATLELLYKGWECQDSMLNVFGFFKYWYEATPDIDKKYRKAIDPELRGKFQKCNYDQDDWINELYVDYYRGPWNIRAGKQIVFWSEVELTRTIDQINQLDLRHSTPGIDPWDEIKMGLWMFRGFYNSHLPGQLIFEGIWIPGDFEPVRTPTEGTFMGDPPAPDLGHKPTYGGQNAAIEKTWNRSRPAVSLRNSSFAARVRGNSEVFLFKTAYLLDWTLSYYHGMNNTPVARHGTIGFASQYNLNPNTLNGYMDTNALSRVFGFKRPKVPSRLWEYKFEDMFGASLQTYVPSLKGVLRGEFLYELGRPESTINPKEDVASYQKSITGTAREDVVNVGVTYDRPIPVGFLRSPSMQWLGSNGTIDASFGWNEQWKRGDVKMYHSTFGEGQKIQTAFNITARTGLRNNELTPVFRAFWNTRKWGYYVLALAYSPGAHVRAEFGYMAFFAHNVWDSNEAHAKGKDQVYLKLGYEF